MKRVLGLLALLLWTQVGQAQSEFKFSGYVVDLPVYQKLNKTIAQFLRFEPEQFLNVTRIRLRPSLMLWKATQLAMEYELNSTYYSTEIPVLLQLQSNRRQLVDMTWQAFEETHFQAVHFIDRLHLKQEFGFGEVVIGRQRIAWGTGRIWNPTDLFNPINPINFAKIEKDGVDAVALKFHLANFTDLMLVCNPQKGETSNSGLRLRSNFHEFDMSFVGGYFDQRIIVGGDFAGNFFDAGVRGEGIISATRDDLKSNFAKFIAGIDYQFTPKLYALAEYHFNGEGAADKRRYDLLRLLAGEILNVGRNYLTLSSSYLVHPLVTATASLTGNLNDRSRFFNLLLSYSLQEESVISLGGQLAGGEAFEEYWYYPNSYYLKAEFYF